MICLKKWRLCEPELRWHLFKARSSFVYLNTPSTCLITLSAARHLICTHTFQLYQEDVPHPKPALKAEDDPWLIHIVLNCIRDLCNWQAVGTCTRSHRRGFWTTNTQSFTRKWGYVPWYLTHRQDTMLIMEQVHASRTTPSCNLVCRRHKKH